MVQDTSNLSEENKYNISKEDKKYIKRICNNNTINLDEKLDVLTDYFNKTSEEIKDMLDFLGMSIFNSQFSAAKSHTLKVKKRYIISSAQTASPVNLSFIRNIEKYAKFIDAEIGIIATRYKNPTSLWKEEGDVWDERIHKYLTANRQYLHKNVLLLADLKIQATSSRPLNGVEVFGGQACCIVGSPRIALKTVPTLPDQNQKFIYSTGSVTIPNFTDTVAGGKAAEHHSFGFIIIEIENDDVVHIRNVEADEDGNFNDLIYKVKNSKITKEGVDCLVWGDLHVAQQNYNVTNAFRKLCKDLQIKVSVLHDVWDSKSINVHNVTNPIIQHKLMKSGEDNLEDELKKMFIELDWFEQNMEKTIVVASNHDDMLDRALVLNDWRNNLKNAEIFVKMLHLTLSGLAPNGIIPYYIKSSFKKIIALNTNDSFIRNNVELAIHGHKGPNGSKGSVQSFSRLATKMIIGHGHSPQIMNGCYQVGVSCNLNHEYNDGLSGWAYASCTLSKSGKRQMIILNKNTLSYTTLY